MKPEESDKLFEQQQTQTHLILQAPVYITGL